VIIAIPVCNRPVVADQTHSKVIFETLKAGSAISTTPMIKQSKFIHALNSKKTVPREAFKPMLVVAWIFHAAKVSSNTVK
jgi:hypothetical protein